MLDSTRDIQSRRRAYQRLLDIAAHADVFEGIRQGLEEAKRVKGRDVEEFFAEFEAKHGISG